MNANIATKVLTVFFCVLVLFLGSLLLFPTQSPQIPIAKRTTITHSSDIGSREADIPSPPKTKMRIERAMENRNAIREETAKLDKLNPDQEFLERIASLPLAQANLIVRTEVERRIKNSEKERAKLIFSEEKKGKITLGYAVKQPSAQEVSSMLKLYQLYLNSQPDQGSKEYVSQKFQDLVDSYRMTQGTYRLLYAIIPQFEGGVPIYQYSFTASSELECESILRQELAPKPPIVIGVPYGSKADQSSSIYAISRWRMDHLIPSEITKYFRQVHQ